MDEMAPEIRNLNRIFLELYSKPDQKFKESFFGAGSHRALETLAQDGYVDKIQRGVIEVVYMLSSKGKIFIETVDPLFVDKPYSWHLEKIEERERRLRRQEELNKLQVKSVIDTNKSVHETNVSTRQMNEETLPRNFRTQRNSTYWSLGLAALSSIFIALTWIQQRQSQTDKELLLLRKQAEKQSQALQDIASCLQEATAAIQQIKKDTFLVKGNLP